MPAELPSVRLRHYARMFALAALGLASCSDTPDCEVDALHAPSIYAKDYDQTCNEDSDCVPVAQGSACDVCESVCQSATINRSALAQYERDYADTNKHRAGGTCRCPAASTPFCRQGMCQYGAAHDVP